MCQIAGWYSWRLQDIADIARDECPCHRSWKKSSSALYRNNTKITADNVITSSSWTVSVRVAKTESKSTRVKWLNHDPMTNIFWIAQCSRIFPSIRCVSKKNGSDWDSWIRTTFEIGEPKETNDVLHRLMHGDVGCGKADSLGNGRESKLNNNVETFISERLRNRWSHDIHWYLDWSMTKK